MLLMSLLIYGVIAALISIILENIGTKVLNSLMDQSTMGYTLVLAFAVVAVVEEGAKFAMLKRRTWNDMNFNYRFDGIVYAVFVSLGFAAFEKNRLSVYRDAAKEAEDIINRWDEELNGSDEPDEYFSD